MQIYGMFLIRTRFQFWSKFLESFINTRKAIGADIIGLGLSSWFFTIQRI